MSMSTLDFMIERNRDFAARPSAAGAFLPSLPLLATARNLSSNLTDPAE